MEFSVSHQTEKRPSQGRLRQMGERAGGRRRGPGGDIDELRAAGEKAARRRRLRLTLLCAQAFALTKFVVKVKRTRGSRGQFLLILQCRQGQTKLINSTCVWVDNTAAIAVAMGNDFTHETVKHVTGIVFFLQECVQCGIIMISYFKMSKNIADIMTKQLAGPQLAEHRDYALGMIGHMT
jgi:hypothetical protein